MRKTLVVFVAAIGGVWAQNPPRPGRGPGFFRPEMGPGGGRLLGGVPGMPGRVVKNAPFTGDLITESTQTLADGNHLRQTTTAHLARDSEGRTRREQSLNGLGALGASSNQTQAVFINDPVAGVNYALNPGNHTATKMSMHVPRGQHAESNGQTAPSGGPRFRTGQRLSQNLTTESLGRQTIEGVPADGTRTTLTIPVGQMGNDLPIQVVTERWYSPDLQMYVLTKHSDPRMGETVTRLTNINRSEPSATLFQVSSDYKVTEGGRGVGHSAAQQ